MILYTKNSFITNMPYMFSYEEGIFVFPFYGDADYTDPYDSSIWTWEKVESNIDEILAVTYGATKYISVSSVANCKGAEQSFFWDDTNGFLYVHHLDSILDYTFGIEERKYANLISGYATDYNKYNKNCYDSVYFDTRIEKIDQITRTADPLEFGLISSNKMKYNLVNQDGFFDEYTKGQSVGSPFFVYAVSHDDSSTTTLDKTNQVFQGYHEGTENNRESLSINGIESRFFENKPVCQNAFTVTEFSDIGDVEGELKPVAFGNIRKGIAVPTNIDALTDSSGSVVLLLADPDIDAITSVSKVYDSKGNELTVTATDLTACTVTVTKPADISPDETKDYTWLGVGYDITVSIGNTDNGLNIIKSCFLHYNNYLYNTDFFDTTQWNAETLLNTEEVGLSIQNDKGWIEEILQPITTSLQGVVEYKGNGKLTFWSRDITADQTAIEYLSITEDTNFYTKNEVASEIVVEYAPNFKTEEALTTLYDDDKEYVTNNYSVNTRGNFSPFKTVLYNESDAALIAAELMQTYRDPTKYYDILTEELNEDLNLFDIVSWNDERFFNYGTNNKAGEILEISYDYIDETTAYKVREVSYIEVDELTSIDDTTGESILDTDYENLIGVNLNG